MQKRIPQELKGEIYEILEVLVKQGVRSTPLSYGILIRDREEQTGDRDLAEHAVYYLRTVSVLDPDRNQLLITARGWEYWEELNTWAPWYWYTKNIFPATVAFGTILFGGASAVTNIVNMVL